MMQITNQPNKYPHQSFCRGIICPLGEIIADLPQWSQRSIWKQ